MLSSFVPIITVAEPSNVKVLQSSVPKYILYLQKVFLKNYFPPQGGWEGASGSAEALLNSDGSINNISIVDRPRNPFKRGHPMSKDADSAIVGAIKISSPVSRPVNRDGRLVIPAKYDWVSNFSDGVCVVYKDGSKVKEADPLSQDGGNFYSGSRSMVINRRGKQPFELKLQKNEMISDFHEGVAVINAICRNPWE